MKGSNSLTHRILPLILVFVLLATALVTACAPKEAGAPDTSQEIAPPGSQIPTTPFESAPAPSLEAPSFTPPWAKGAQKPNVAESWRDSDTIGLAVGGAKGIDNFRANIKNGYLPLPTDITYEGLFYEYYFDTGQTKSCRKLFCPSYSYAVTRDPFSKKAEYYLSVGLNSGMEERDFERKKLNLVIVLDISGSMSSPFNQYYYDRFGNQVGLDWKERNTQKIEVAKDAVIDVLNQLDNVDRFGIVLFNERAHLLQRMTQVRHTDMDDVEDNILDALDIQKKVRQHAQRQNRLFGSSIIPPIQKELIDKKLCADSGEAQKYLSANCTVRHLVVLDEKQRKQPWKKRSLLEHYAICVIEPEYNISEEFER